MIGGIGAEGVEDGEAAGGGGGGAEVYDLVFEFVLEFVFEGKASSGPLWASGG